MLKFLNRKLQIPVWIWLLINMTLATSLFETQYCIRNMRKVLADYKALDTRIATMTKLCASLKATEAK